MSTPPEPTPAPVPVPVPPAVPPAPVPAVPPVPATEPEPVDLQAEVDKWKALSRQNEQRAKDNAAAAARLAEIEDAAKTDAQRLTDQLKAADDRATAATRLATSSTVQALAAAGFEDAEDAVGARDWSKFVTDGVIDTEGIKAELTALLAAKPHWAKATGPRLPRPDPSQGPRPGALPGDLTAQIAEAKAKGDWKKVVSLENSKLANVKTT
ncbi:hypothetical protein [Actinacidiphila sp. ITFR-21]|uniref:hypothetical protein n=1 Tax=Actinacidiphila sp. ITFR-21 TaxID=3075199 RepID=UPI00288B5888|nr:hypothetical protein [Streptomyces sp. ITFR-21]WNI16621.1 hypothetical protein RLT57_14615 [Streptomyces sp. ITFR-21]